MFNINLAKWKRWSREFLPPDPLGGLQSGYARQYSPDEAFTVFLGGHLVGDLKFSISETKQILVDLHQWLVDHDFYFYFSKNSGSAKNSAPDINYYQLAISCGAFTEELLANELFGHEKGALPGAATHNAKRTLAAGRPGPGYGHRRRGHGFFPRQP